MTPRKVYREESEDLVEPVTYFEDQNGVPQAIMLFGLELGNVITPQIEHIFTSGQCHSLAIALHEILGWEVMGTYDLFGGGPRDTRHFVVQCPDRRGDADIRGIRCLDHGLRKASVDVILGGRGRGFLPPAMKFARHYAKIIAPEIQKQWDALKAGKRKPRWTLCSEGYDDK
jgi:hypothetical protein